MYRNNPESLDYLSAPLRSVPQTGVSSTSTAVTPLWGLSSDPSVVVAERQLSGPRYANCKGSASFLGNRERYANYGIQVSNIYTLHILASVRGLRV